MASSQPTPKMPFVRKYDLDFQQAEKLYDEERYEEAREAAKYNLTDPTLPRWHKIKNHLLWAHASDSWQDAEQQRLEAENIYSEALALTPDHRKHDHEALREVRASLDYLAQAQKEDYDDNLKEAEESQHLSESLHNEETGLLEATGEDKGVSSELVLPFHNKPSSSAKDAVPSRPEAFDPRSERKKHASSTGSIRRKKQEEKHVREEPQATAKAPPPPVEDMFKVDRFDFIPPKRPATK